MPSEYKHLIITAVLGLSAVSSPVFAVGVTQEVEDALNFYHYGKNGAVKLDLNYRWENVDQDIGKPQTANANTARLRLGLLSPVFYGLQGYAEYEGNLAMQEDYNSTRNGNTGYSTVADPDHSELNQLWVNYTGIADTEIKGGRQRIKLDDDRFVGNVGWRQMETTFDAVLLTHKNQQLFGLTVNAGYIGNVNTFTATTENINAPILNLNYKVGDYGNAVAYGYWLDYTEKDTYEKSSQTYGLKMSNYQKPGDSLKLTDNFGVVYTAEYSNQQDYGHGQTNYEADRYNVMGGVTAYNFTVQGAMEQLGGGGLNKTFDTPLGTNHAFQGWADLFLTTPANGIRDVFGTLVGQFEGGSTVATFVYHDYHDDTSSVHYGKEYDAQVLKKFGKHYSLLAKYAFYDADKIGTDTQKIWLQGNISF
ncbi:MAG: alginate export family protein [Methylococcaceae bacterium]